MGSPLAFLPVLMMLVGAMGVGALLLGLNYVLGRKVRTKLQTLPYESGMPLGDSHKRISVKFFIVAMIFILFDVEAAFLYLGRRVPAGRDARSSSRYSSSSSCCSSTQLVISWKKGAFDWK